MRRNRRIRTITLGGLLQDQRDYLIYGPADLALFKQKMPFDSEDEARDAWHAHRAELMALHQPGRRPYAFFAYDLGVFPAAWDEQIAALLTIGAISAQEASDLERSYPMLEPGQPGFCRAFEEPASIAAMNLDRATLVHQAREFDTAARFHNWRDHPTIAERYRHLAAVTREVIQDAA